MTEFRHRITIASAAPFYAETASAIPGWLCAVGRERRTVPGGHPTCVDHDGTILPGTREYVYSERVERTWPESRIVHFDRIGGPDE